MSEIDEIKQQLEQNPHWLQMIEEAANDPALLARLEAGNIEAVKECSLRAKAHFLDLVVGVHHHRDREDVFDDLVHQMSERVYNRIRKGDTRL